MRPHTSLYHPHNHSFCTFVIQFRGGELTSDTENFGDRVTKHAESECSIIFVFYSKLSIKIVINMFFHVFQHQNLALNSPATQIGREATQKHNIDQNEWL